MIMSYAIVYSTRTGNSKVLANVIYNYLNPSECIYFGNVEDADYSVYKADIIYVGFWTDQGKCDKLTEDFLTKLYNKKVFLFGSAGFGAHQEYFDKIIERIKALTPASVEIVDSFICQGRMPKSVYDKYEKLKHSPVNVPNIDMLIENYHHALSHPDAEDFKHLTNKLDSYR